MPIPGKNRIEKKSIDEKRIEKPIYKHISLDTETTGLDFWHGCQPFLITTMLPTGENDNYHWRVDPKTRRVLVEEEGVEAIKRLLDSSERIVLHNAKFDFHALKTVGIELDWSKVDDTLIAGHLLGSNLPHNLTDMVLDYCDISIKGKEKKLEEACKKSRSLCRTKLKDWRIAQKGMEELPSCRGSGNKHKSDSRGSEKDSAWFFDSWLPKEVAEELEYPADHAYRTVTEDYASHDSSSTLILWQKLSQLIDQRGLRRHYEERMKLLPIVAEMEENGVTLSGGRLESLKREYEGECASYKQICLDLAKKEGFDNLRVPEGNRNDSVQEFLFDHLKVIPNARTQTGIPAMDKRAFDAYLTDLSPEGTAHQFFQALSLRSTRKTAISYLEGYKRFWLRADVPGSNSKNWKRLHPNFNPTGTNTIRFSSSNPNAQNCSKKPGFNLRYAFGPLPGREWWALDYENLELRIPAYESGEQAMIDLFENPDEPPFFGSYHLLVFSILHPEMWAKWGKGIKDDTCPDRAWYGWTKNGNFAVQYNAQESSGTADRAYHMKGAQRLLQSRFKNTHELSIRMVEHATKHGLVYTMPRKNVDPTKGYPLLCKRTQYNKILPTTPLSYHVQGTAMECTTSAMVRCEPALQEWSRRSRSRYDSEHYFMTLQVHDEIVFDMPKGQTPTTNLPKVNELKRLMELSGDDISIPLKVSISYHPETWSKSQKI